MLYRYKSYLISKINQIEVTKHWLFSKFVHIFLYYTKYILLILFTKYLQSHISLSPFKNKTQKAKKLVTAPNQVRAVFRKGRNSA